MEKIKVFVTYRELEPMPSPDLKKAWPGVEVFDDQDQDFLIIRYSIIGKKLEKFSFKVYFILERGRKYNHEDAERFVEHAENSLLNELKNYQEIKWSDFHENSHSIAVCKIEQMLYGWEKIPLIRAVES